MNIGHFTKTNDGNFIGYIAAIGAVLSEVSFEAIAAEGNDPDYRVIARGCDLGSAWNKISARTGKPYISVSLKSPFLPAAVYAALFDTDEAGTFVLVWKEPKAKAAD